MQDLSQPTGSNTIVKIAGQEVVLGGVTLEDIGTIHGEVLRMKRKAKLQTAHAMKDWLPPDEFAVEWAQAKAESDKVALVEEDFKIYMQSIEGTATIIWILAERQYPGRFRRSQIHESLLKNELFDSSTAALDLSLSFEALQQRGNG